MVRVRCRIIGYKWSRVQIVESSLSSQDYKLNMVYLHTKFDYCSHSRGMIGGTKI